VYVGAKKIVQEGVPSLKLFFVLSKLLHSEAGPSQGLLNLGEGKKRSSGGGRILSFRISRLNEKRLSDWGKVSHRSKGEKKQKKKQSTQEAYIEEKMPSRAGDQEEKSRKGLVLPGGDHEKT